MNKIENGPLCGKLEKDIGKQEIMHALRHGENKIG